MYYSSIEASGQGTSEWVRLDSGNNSRKNSSYTLGVIVEGTLKVDVEFCIDPNLDTPAVYCHPILNNTSSSSASDLGFPVSAFRLNIKEHTSGTAKLEVLQSNL